MTDLIPLVVEIWSDFVCPFCYLQEPVVQRLRGEQGDSIDLRWRAFELRPEPGPRLDPKSLYLQNIWARSVYPMAAERGMKLLLPPVQPSSRKAFEATEFARTQGAFQQMHHELFKAFFEFGLNIGDTDVLVQIGRSIGLNGQSMRDSIEAGDFATHVARDESEAKQLGITGVPAMVIYHAGISVNDGVRVSGAQDYRTVSEAIEFARRRPSELD